MNFSDSKIFFILILLFSPILSFAQVSHVVFVTEEQSIKPNESSGAITIQTQNSSAESENVGETSDVFLQSSSPTGKFSSNAENWEDAEKMTMNSNWANRTFYYKDSAMGTFTINVRVVGRTSLKEWTASQKITVSSSETINNNTSGEVLSANTESSMIPAESATSGAVAPSYATLASQLEVSAGGDRLTTPGSPISFQALIKKNNYSNSAVKFQWSFGDGYTDDGALVSHIYKYPGDYAVVLNARAGNTFAVARLKVKVAQLDLKLAETDAYVEISNNATSEVNLFNWKIISNHKGFIFQPDTIIFPKSNIKIDRSLLKIKGEQEENTVLKNHLGEVVASLPKITEAEDLKEASARMNEIWRETASVLDKAMVLNLVKESEPKPVKKIVPEEAGEIAGESVEYRQMLEDGADTEPLGEVIYESPTRKSFISKMMGFLIDLFAPLGEVD